jgi:thioredoxin-dependent peroxiredoxin
MASFGRYMDDDAKKMFPEGWRSPKPHIRIVKQPV